MLQLNAWMFLQYGYDPYSNVLVHSTLQVIHIQQLRIHIIALLPFFPYIHLPTNKDYYDLQRYKPIVVACLPRVPERQKSTHKSYRFSYSIPADQITIAPFLSYSCLYNTAYRYYEELYKGHTTDLMPYHHQVDYAEQYVHNSQIHQYSISY